MENKQILTEEQLSIEFSKLNQAILKEIKETKALIEGIKRLSGDDSQ